MNEEYNMLRNESTESIAKQDTLTNILFTVLGASSVFSTLNVSIPFIILIELISAVLLARILHYRHVMLYVSTYLERIEKTTDCNIHWQTNLRSFHATIPKVYPSWNFIQKSLWHIVNVARGSKHLGNMILSIYLFSPLFPKLKDMCVITGKSVTLNYEILFALSALILNIVLSFGICFLYKIRSGYDLAWEKAVPNLSETELEIQK